MKLTIEQQRKLLDRVSELVADHPCDFCGNQAWSASRTIYELREYDRGSFDVVNSAVAPIIAVHCTKCANMRFFGAIALGLIDPKTGEWIDG
jgi:hypothetical protein